MRGGGVFNNIIKGSIPVLGLVEKFQNYVVTNKNNSEKDSEYTEEFENKHKQLNSIKKNKKIAEKKVKKTVEKDTEEDIEEEDIDFDGDDTTNIFKNLFGMGDKEDYDETESVDNFVL